MKNLAVYRETDYDELDMGKILQDFDWQPKKGSIVFIKPNLSAIWPKPGEITHPKVIESLIKYLLKFNCEIVIGETDNLGPKDKGWNFNDIIGNSNYSKFRKYPHVKVVEIEKLPQKEIEVDGLKLSLPQLIFDCDYYINVAKLKTHWQSNVTLSLKNQMGIVPMDERKIFHRTDLEKSIALLASQLQPDLVMIDGIEAMEGQAPHWGEMKNAELIIVGNNMVEVDSLASFIMGFDPKTIRHLKLAQDLKIGKIPQDFDQFRKFKTNFKKGTQHLPISFKKFHVWQENGHACTGCGRAVELIKKNILKQSPKMIIDFIKKAFLSDTNILLGRIDFEKTKIDYKNLRNIYCIGNCSGEFAKEIKCPHLNGCPPTNQEVMDWLLK